MVSYSDPHLLQPGLTKTRHFALHLVAVRRLQKLSAYIFSEVKSGSLFCRSILEPDTMVRAEPCMVACCYQCVSVCEWEANCKALEEKCDINAAIYHLNPTLNYQSTK